MTNQYARLFAGILLLLSAGMRVPDAIAGDHLPVVLISSSGAFDRQCPAYYRQGNDAEVTTDIAKPFCACIAGNVEAQGLGSEVLDFLGRTYSEDLTAFIGDYPNGEAWMEAYFAAEKECKTNADFGSNETPAKADGIAAGSWGGVVRSGPGRSFKKIGSLEKGDEVTLLENTGRMDDGYPWWKIAFDGDREGYQWGGILCGLKKPVDGVYEVCD